MNYYLGIDIGTSGTKADCFTVNGDIVISSYADYPLYSEKPGYSEQNPNDWFLAVKKVILDITSKGYKISGIGLSGQMHGLVILDTNDNILRNSIIWCDNRAVLEAEELKNNIGDELIKKITGNPVVPAFTLSKLLWVKNNEPDIYKKIAKIMLPKDYIRYMLTKEFKTEYSDASGMQMIDIYNKCYSKEILDYLNINEQMLPELIESIEISGYISQELQSELLLDGNCFVVGGAGDQAAAAIGNGIISKGDVSVVLGSSGVVFSPITKNDLEDNNLQVFMHAVPDTYHVMGVTNGCGLSYKWFKENFGKESTYNELNELASKSNVGANNLIYLPYLNGERTPHMDPYASGTFVGIRQYSSYGDFVRAILEGVAFSLKDCFSLLPEANYNVLITGGGAKGKLWCDIISSVLNLPLNKAIHSESGTLGVSILAMVAGKEYNNIKEACNKIIKYKDKITPYDEWIKEYNSIYDKYKKLYLSLKNYYKEVF